MSALTLKGQDELKRFGWKLGPEFEQRYLTDAWVFNLANAVETVASERDEALALLRRIADYTQEHWQPACTPIDNGILSAVAHLFNRLAPSDPQPEKVEQVVDSRPLSL